MAEIRKDKAPRGTRTQKHVAFRMDLDLVPLLENVPNKGRFINEAIREKLERK